MKNTLFPLLSLWNRRFISLIMALLLFCDTPLLNAGSNNTQANSKNTTQNQLTTYLPQAPLMPAAGLPKLPTINPDFPQGEFSASTMLAPIKANMAQMHQQINSMLKEVTENKNKYDMNVGTPQQQEVVKQLNEEFALYVEKIKADSDNSYATAEAALEALEEQNKQSLLGKIDKQLSFERLPIPLALNSMSLKRAVPHLRVSAGGDEALAQEDIGTDFASLTSDVVAYQYDASTKACVPVPKEGSACTCRLKKAANNSGKVSVCKENPITKIRPELCDKSQTELVDAKSLGRDMRNGDQQKTKASADIKECEKTPYLIKNKVKEAQEKAAAAAGTDTDTDEQISSVEVDEDSQKMPDGAYVNNLPYECAWDTSSNSCVPHFTTPISTCMKVVGRSGSSVKVKKEASGAITVSDGSGKNIVTVPGTEDDPDPNTKCLLDKNPYLRRIVARVTGLGLGKIGVDAKGQDKMGMTGSYLQENGQICKEISGCAKDDPCFPPKKPTCAAEEIERDRAFSEYIEWIKNNVKGYSSCNSNRNATLAEGNGKMQCGKGAGAGGAGSAATSASTESTSTKTSSSGSPPPSNINSVLNPEKKETARYLCLRKTPDAQNQEAAMKKFLEKKGTPYTCDMAQFKEVGGQCVKLDAPDPSWQCLTMPGFKPSKDSDGLPAVLDGNCGVIEYNSESCCIQNKDAQIKNTCQESWNKEIRGKFKGLWPRMATASNNNIGSGDQDNGLSEFCARYLGVADVSACRALMFGTGAQMDIPECKEIYGKVNGTSLGSPAPDQLMLCASAIAKKQSDEAKKQFQQVQIQYYVTVALFATLLISMVVFFATTGVSQVSTGQYCNDLTKAINNLNGLLTPAYEHVAKCVGECAETPPVRPTSPSGCSADLCNKPPQIVQKTMDPCMAALNNLRLTAGAMCGNLNVSLGSKIASFTFSCGSQSEFEQCKVKDKSLEESKKRLIEAHQQLVANCLIPGDDPNILACDENTATDKMHSCWLERACKIQELATKNKALHDQLVAAIQPAVSDCLKAYPDGSCTGAIVSVTGRRGTSDCARARAQCKCMLNYASCPFSPSEGKETCDRDLVTVNSNKNFQKINKVINEAIVKQLPQANGLTDASNDILKAINGVLINKENFAHQCAYLNWPHFLKSSGALKWIGGIGALNALVCLGTELKRRGKMGKDAGFNPANKGKLPWTPVMGAMGLLAGVGSGKDKKANKVADRARLMCGIMMGCSAISAAGMLFSDDGAMWTGCFGCSGLIMLAFVGLMMATYQQFMTYLDSVHKKYKKLSQYYKALAELYKMKIAVAAESGGDGGDQTANNQGLLSEMRSFYDEACYNNGNCNRKTTGELNEKSDMTAIEEKLKKSGAVDSQVLAKLNMGFSGDKANVKKAGVEKPLTPDEQKLLAQIKSASTFPGVKEVMGRYAKGLSPLDPKIISDAQNAVNQAWAQGKINQPKPNFAAIANQTPLPITSGMVAHLGSMGGGGISGQFKEGDALPGGEAAKPPEEAAEQAAPQADGGWKSFGSDGGFKDQSGEPGDSASYLKMINAANNWTNDPVVKETQEKWQGKAGTRDGEETGAVVQNDLLTIDLGIFHEVTIKYQDKEENFKEVSIFNRSNESDLDEAAETGPGAKKAGKNAFLNALIEQNKRGKKKAAAAVKE